MSTSLKITWGAIKYSLSRPIKLTSLWVVPRHWHLLKALRVIFSQLGLRAAPVMLYHHTDHGKMQCLAWMQCLACSTQCFISFVCLLAYFTKWKNSKYIVLCLPYKKFVFQYDIYTVKYVNLKSTGQGLYIYCSHFSHTLYTQQLLRSKYETLRGALSPLPSQ